MRPTRGKPVALETALSLLHSDSTSIKFISRLSFSLYIILALNHNPSDSTTESLKLLVFAIVFDLLY